MAYNETLLNEIKRCNELYRAGTPIVSDTEYDAMVERLKRIDPENEWFKHIEPASVTSNRKVKLPVPMKSLNKVKTTRELIAWIKSLGIGNDGYLVITPKFDGLSLLHNESSEAAYSRGGSETKDKTVQHMGKWLESHRLQKGLRTPTENLYSTHALGPQTSKTKYLQKQVINTNPLETLPLDC